MSVSIQHEDFDAGAVMAELRATSNNVGAMVSFVGLVRDLSYDDKVENIFVEHYPGMSEKALNKIIAEAKQRWELLAVKVIHRVGKLGANDQIVLVATASSHRGNAFSSCEFIIDYLKTDAPFWKKEVKNQGGEWVVTKDSDVKRMERWGRSSAQ
ncbi:MAG TPA: molybdenum cofactor biosynthesis protein MoaE [Gallionellaceae bacterium]|nr:molybdenum cofactor biosynthesis protein MoaE [Gallionellaceae bacterium]